MEIRLVPLLLPLPSLLLFLLSSYPYAPPRVYYSLHRVFLALTVTAAPPQQPQQQSASLTGRGMLTPAVWGGVGAVIFVAVAAFASFRASLAKVALAPPTPTALASETSTAAAKDCAIPAKASFAALLTRMTDAPLHALASMAAEYAQLNESSEAASGAAAGAGAASDVTPTGGVPFAVVILRHAEKIDPEALSSLLNLLRISAAHLRIHLVAFNSAIVPLPLRLSKTGQSLVDVSIHASEAPWELYDDLMARLFAAREVPVSLPSNLIAWIHDSFWRSQSCVKAACDKVSLSLAHHFSSRRALLCMFEETQWLLDMKLCRRPVGAPNRTAEDNKLNAISQLMEYLGADDVAGTGIRLALQSDLGGRGGLQGRATEVMGAQAILQRAIERMRLDREWFLRLKRLRDTFLAPHPSSSSSSSSSSSAAASASSQRSDYCSDILEGKTEGHVR